MFYVCRLDRTTPGHAPCPLPNIFILFLAILCCYLTCGPDNPTTIASQWDKNRGFVGEHFSPIQLFTIFYEKNIFPYCLVGIPLMFIPILIRAQSIPTLTTYSNFKCEVYLEVYNGLYD